MDILANGKIILVRSARTGKFLRRHPNDLKKFEGSIPDPTVEYYLSEGEVLQAWGEAFQALDDTRDDEWFEDTTNTGTQGVEQLPNRRSNRERTANIRYYNNDFDTT